MDSNGFIVPASPIQAVDTRNQGSIRFSIVICVHSCPSVIHCSCLTMNRFFDTWRWALFQPSVAPALPDRSYREKQGLLTNLGDWPPTGSTAGGALVSPWDDVRGWSLPRSVGVPPALPGGASSNRSCSSKGRARDCRNSASADAAQPSRLVALRSPSCRFVDRSFLVCFR